MALSTQMKTLRAIREILLGDGRNALPPGNDPKPHFPGNSNGNKGTKLPRSTPEAEGLSSTELEAFYRAIAAAPLANAHALLVLRHGKVISEGYFAPYTGEVWHVTHSLCKSFIGAAVGIAIEEGLFGLDDTIADYFPEQMGLFTARRIKAITVRHLLTMASGISYNEVNEAVDTDWIKGIFSSPVAFEPGERFVYNSMNSYLLSALICKVTGGTVVEYLTPRLFEPLGFGPVGWEKSPAGYEKGGWGMYIMVEDMAKMGQLYLQKGRWNVDGTVRQLIPETWIEESTCIHARGDAGETYGYHIWIDGKECNPIMNGMFGQYITILPEQDMVIAMTAGNPQMFTDSPAYTVMRETFYGRTNIPNSLPPNPRAYARLQSALGQLLFRQPLPQAAPPKRLPSKPTRGQRWRTARAEVQQGIPQEAMAFCGTSWVFGRNRAGLLPIIVQAMNNNFTAGLRALRLECAGDVLLHWEEGKGQIAIPVGFHHAQRSRVRIGKESFLLASVARLGTGAEGEPVLLIDICLPEHSSFRQLRLRLADGNLDLHLDEQPQFKIAIENIITQGENTGTAPQRSSPFSGLLRQNEFLLYRVAQLCAPDLTGTPAPPE